MMACEYAMIGNSKYTDNMRCEYVGNCPHQYEVAHEWHCKIHVNIDHRSEEIVREVYGRLVRTTRREKK